MMKKLAVITVIVTGTVLLPSTASAQYKTKDAPEAGPRTEVQTILDQAE
mgnify:FL=1